MSSSLLCCSVWLGSNAVSWDEGQSWKKGAGEKGFTSREAERASNRHGSEPGEDSSHMDCALLHWDQKALSLLADGEHQHLGAE